MISSNMRSFSTVVELCAHELTNDMMKFSE